MLKQLYVSSDTFPGFVLIALTIFTVPNVSRYMLSEKYRIGFQTDRWDLQAAVQIHRNASPHN